MQAAPSIRPLRIFVVENHGDTLRYFKMYLETCGHTVFPARTMTEAYRALPDADVDVLISDIGLPDGTGWELLERLRQIGAAPRYALAVSGYGTAADRARSEAVGFRHHLTKPFNPDDLDRWLEEAGRELEFLRCRRA